ncbi:MAG: two-component regulator propeller domain-containing protein, partial [Bacteroidota bacterium]
MSLLPDADGMWIGTEDGLNFFDGYHWQHWPRYNGELTERQISFLQKDQAGFLWIFHAQDFKDRSTISSIDLLSPERDSVFSAQMNCFFTLPFSPTEIQHFFTDQDNTLHFFANDQLWNYTQLGQFQDITLPEGFQPHAVLTDGIFIGRLNEKLVLMTAAGEVLETLDYPLQNCSFDFLGDEEHFWIFQLDGPCKMYRRSSQKFTYKSEEVILPELSYAFPALLHYNAKQGEIWIKNGQNVYLLDAENRLKFHYPKAARQIVQDQSGAYWLGKNQIDLLQLGTKKFEHFLWNEAEDGPNRTRCRGIVEKDGQLYVSTYRGVRRINLADKSVHQPVNYDTLGFSFLKDPQEQLWLGRRDVVKLDSTNTKVQAYYQADRTRIWSLFADQNGVIWLGTQKGLSRLQAGQVYSFEQYNGYHALRDALVLFFYPDTDGTVWVGSDKGLFQLDPVSGIMAAYG